MVCRLSNSVSPFALVNAYLIIFVLEINIQKSLKLINIIFLKIWGNFFSTETKKFGKKFLP